MDERVIDVNVLLRNLLVRGIILNTRPKKSAEAYSKVWTDEGSPLIVTSRKLEEEVRQLWDGPVSLGMRYGNPSILQSMEEIREAGADEAIVVPLYPHYSMSSYETVVAKVLEEHKAKRARLQQRALPRVHVRGFGRRLVAGHHLHVVRFPRFPVPRVPVGSRPSCIKSWSGFKALWLQPMRGEAFPRTTWEWWAV